MKKLLNKFSSFVKKLRWLKFALSIYLAYVLMVIVIGFLYGIYIGLIIVGIL